jgi:hypothetical protein
MKVQFARVEPPCGTEELRALEAAAPSLPDDYLAFLEQRNGGRLEPNELPGRGLGLGEIFSAAGVVRSKARLADRLPDECWPIADAEGGNLVLLRYTRAGWLVTFWDHETEEDEVVAQTFAGLLDTLVPLGEVGPARVINAWIDPDFLRNAK